VQPRTYEPVPSHPAQIDTDNGGSRLRTVTGNRFPRKCSCGCGQPIPRDPEIRFVVDFGAPKPFPAYLCEHSPDYGTYRAVPRSHDGSPKLPGFVPASRLQDHAEPAPAPAPEVKPLESSAPPRPTIEISHTDDDATASPEAGRPWASGQLVFNAGSFESARSGFADYARDGETSAQLRARVNRTILEDLWLKVIALRALHERLRERLEGPSFGDLVARGWPR
jgi:hypothetical protein